MWILYNAHFIPVNVEFEIKNGILFQLTMLYLFITIFAYSKDTGDYKSSSQQNILMVYLSLRNDSSLSLSNTSL